MRHDVPSSTHKVTLVTGDVVTVTTLADGQQIADVNRPVDAVGGVRIQERGGDLYVVPDEAVGLLGAGRLDPRLFDVTDLDRDGLRRRRHRPVPMIATYTPRRDPRRATPSAPDGSTLVRRLSVGPRRGPRARKRTSARSGTPSLPTPA